jgi:hypothetical protein
VSALGALPFLTVPDPATTGEGALDPLGLSPIGDRLAERVLPGLRARMARPRFLTAMAVCAAVCDGLEDVLASDGITPPRLVFEWLLVEAFGRCGEREAVKGTPGTQKAQLARESGVPLSAKAYLRVPTVFGFNGVYMPLARSLDILRDDFGLGDNGYGLLKVWESEQGLDGFHPASTSPGPGKSFREMLRSAVLDGMRAGHTTRGSGWHGWRLLADHLSPGRAGPHEAAYLLSLLRQGSETRAEMFDLLAPVNGDVPEAVIVRDHLIARSSSELGQRLQSVSRYEDVCTLLEDAFEEIRYLSSVASTRPISPGDFASSENVTRIVEELPSAMLRAEKALSAEALPLQSAYRELVTFFDDKHSAGSLFEALLARHAAVQKRKPPEGKRDWFERDVGGGTIVRPQYRRLDPVQQRDWWSRPYRVDAARSFLRDFGGANE